MARLPDVQSLGRRRTPQATRGVSNVTQLAAPAERAVRAQGRAADIQAQNAPLAGAPADILSQTAGNIEEAALRIQSRSDAVSRARTLGEVQAKVDEELLRVSQEEDLSNPEVAKKFNETVREMMNDALKNHSGSSDSKARLASSLEERRASVGAKAAGMAFEAQRAAVSNLLNGQMNILSSTVRQAPETLGEQRLAMREMLKDYADALTPQEEQAFIRAGDSILGEAAIESLIFAGQVDFAEQALLEQPGLLRSLDPAAQQRLFQKIERARTELTSGTREGMQDVAYLRAVLGREPTDTERVEKAGVAPSSPLVSINQGENEFLKQMAKSDVEVITSANERAEVSRRALYEIERIQIALQSGRFTTGVFSDARHFLARTAEFFGASPEVQQMIGDAATADVLDGASKALAVEVAQKLGRITNMSLGFAVDSLPALFRTPEGNEILAEVMQRAAHREMEIADIANRYASDFQTLRPQGDISYFQAVRELEERDPVITEELRSRILKGSENAPQSFTEVFSGDKPTIGSIEEYNSLESGTEFYWEPTKEWRKKP